MRTLRKKDSIENPKKLTLARALDNLSKGFSWTMLTLIAIESAFIFGYAPLNNMQLNNHANYFGSAPKLVERIRKRNYLEDTKERISKSNWWGKTVEIVGFPTITMPMAYGDKLFLAQQDAKNNPNSKQNPDRTYEESFM